MLTHDTTPDATPVTTKAVDAEQARCIEIDRSYAHYKDSGAKLRYEIETAVALERRWNPGCLS